MGYGERLRGRIVTQLDFLGLVVTQLDSLGASLNHIVLKPYRFQDC